MSYFSHLSPGPDADPPPLPEPRPAGPGQWPELEAALAVVNRDVAATLPGQGPLILVVAPSGEPALPNGTDRGYVHVALADGRWHGSPVNAYDLEEGDAPEADDAATVLSVVAEAAQETVMEVLWEVWPTCREHNTGTHVRPSGTTADGRHQDEADMTGPPVWWCRGGRDGDCHDVSAVGELAATMPGK